MQHEMQRKKRKSPVNPNSFLWTWGESNPCPKAYSSRHLPSQSSFWHSLGRTPNDRLTASVASWFLLLPQSFGSKVPHRIWCRLRKLWATSGRQAALRLLTRNYLLRLYLGSGLLRGPGPRMASLTAKPPSKPVQALVFAKDNPAVLVSLHH